MVDQELKLLMARNLLAHTQAGKHNLAGHQIDPILATVAWLDRPIVQKRKGYIQGKLHDGGVINMCTGSGKTWVELEMALASGQRAIIASPRLKINSYIADTFSDPDKLNFNPDDIAIYDSERSPEEKARALAARILVTTPQGIVSLHAAGHISPNPSSKNYRPLMLLDEGDLFTGYEIGRVVQQYVPSVVVLTFSATSYGINRRLFDNQPDIHDLPIRKGVTEGLLCHGVKTAVIEVDPKASDVEAYVNENKGSSPVSEDALREEAVFRKKIEAIIRMHTTHVDDEMGAINELPTLIAVDTIEEADKATRYIEQHCGPGYAVAVSGNTLHDDYEDKVNDEQIQGLNTILERFHNGQQKIIVFPAVLGRGVDMLHASVLFSTRISQSPTDPTQFLGRLTRRVGDEYAQLFGGRQEKFSLAVNVQETGTRQFLFSNVIGGPTLYDIAAARKHRKSTPPVPPPTLPEPIGVTAITSVQELAAIYRQSETYVKHNTIPDGFIHIADAAHRLDVDIDEVKERVAGIKRNQNYTAHGFPPPPDCPDMPLYRGDQLVVRRGNIIYVSDVLVGAYQELMREEQPKLETPAGVDLNPHVQKVQADAPLSPNQKDVDKGGDAPPPPRQGPIVEEISSGGRIDAATAGKIIGKLLDPNAFAKGADDQTVGEAKKVPEDVGNRLEGQEKGREDKKK